MDERMDVCCQDNNNLIKKKNKALYSILSPTTLTFKGCMLCRDTANTNIQIFGLNKPQLLS